MKGWCFLRNKNLTSISYINWRYCKCSTIKYVVAELFLLLLIELFAYTLLPHFSLHSNISTIITFSSAWIIYKQFWRSCGIFGSNQSFIITFHPPSVSRSSSTSLIFHSTSISIDVRGIFPPAGNLLHLFVEITREIVHRLNKNYVRRWSHVIRRRWTDERREGGSMNSSWRIFTAQLNVLVSNASLGHGHPSRGDQSCFTLTLTFTMSEIRVHSSFDFYLYLLLYVKKNLTIS